jgi:hypothetical protein
VTAPLVHQRPIRGQCRWARHAWALVRAEMGQARAHLNAGDAFAAVGHLREARMLVMLARKWDRHTLRGAL